MSTSTRGKRSAVDSACAEAVDDARAAALEVAGSEVGDHLGYVSEDERVVTHHFGCSNVAYSGWHWAVTVVRASRAKNVTVSDVVLLPGDTAILSPPWVPWEERLRPGDLGPGDILPTLEDDDRVMPGWAAAPTPPFDPEASQEQWWVAAEAGLVRPRVMSPLGRADTIDRWYSTERGPDAAISVGAPSNCASCGFGLPMAGSIGRLFAVCANEYAPDDGHVVSLDHGCGAHSEVDVAPVSLADRPAPVLDEISFHVVDVTPIERDEAIAADPASDAAEIPAADESDESSEPDQSAEATEATEDDAPAP